MAVASIATLRAQVTQRCNTSGVAPDPTDTQIEDYLRQSFLRLIGVLHPITQVTVTLSSMDDRGETLTGTLGAAVSRVYYVEVGDRLLFPSEWTVNGTTLTIKREAAQAGDTAVLYVQAKYSITLGLTATIDTTCIFGEEWLSELAILETCLTVYQALMRQAASASGPNYLQQHALFKERYKEILPEYAQTFNEWRGTMEERLKARLAVNDTPFTAGPFDGWTNESYISNRRTGW